MALSNSDLSDLLDALRVGEGVDLIREIARWVLQELIETEATQQIGAGRYERVDERLNERNGHRPKTLSTKPATCSSESPSSAKARSFRRFSSRAVASIKPCTRW